jgi:predicted amidophosphoribosyltransferase
MPTYKHPCPVCGNFIQRDVARCPFCGRVDPFTPGRCERCGAAIEDPKWVACPRCGASLGEEKVTEMYAAPPGAPAAAPARPAAAVEAAAPALPVAPAAPVAPPVPPPAASSHVPEVQVPAGPRAFCTACGRPLDPGARFCTTCGTLVE